MDIQIQTIWDRVLDDLRAKVHPQTFLAWFYPLKTLDIRENRVTVQVPDEFFKGWLIDRHLPLLQQSFCTVLGKDVLIELVVAAVPAPAEPHVGPLTSGSAFVPEEPAPPEHSKQKEDLEADIGAGRPSLQGLNQKYTFDNFVIGPSNRFAHAAAMAICASPAKVYNPLFIYGGVGLGKTHLMHSIGHQISQHFSGLHIVYTSSENFTNQLIAAIQNRTTEKFRNRYRSVDVLIIDDIHFIAGKESTQEAFFHTFNALYDDHKQIIISSDRPPKEIPRLEERLVSRFEWGLVTDIQPPELETRIAILKKKAEKETIEVPNDVFFAIAEKIRSNIRELEGALIRVVAYAKLMNEPISVQLVKNVLKEMFVEEEKKITVSMIQKRVSDHFNVSVSDMRGKRKLKEIAYPRQVGMFLSRKLTSISLSEIGNYFGGRDHTTILHACDKIEKAAKKDGKLQDLLALLEQDLRTS